VKASTIVILVVVGIALAIAGYLYFGDGGLLVGLFALLPAGKNLLATTKHAGKVEQADADREASQEQRDELGEDWKQIDAETEETVKTSDKKWDGVAAAPTVADEAEMLARFGVDQYKPPTPSSDDTEGGPK
jgi:hypothetical protein